jgi:hypothetical protein
MTLSTKQNSPKHHMKELSNSELGALPLDQLVDRMDEFLQNIYDQRNPLPVRVQVAKLPTQLIATPMVTSLDEGLKRHIAYSAYSFLLHLEMNLTGCGIANQLLYGPKHDAQSWSDPFFRLNDGVLYQYQLVGSRITFEVFMDLLSLIGTGRMCPTRGHSKIKGFRNWILNDKTPFRYFGHVLLAAYEFDRKHRSPVVHGASELPRRMLRMESNGSNLTNETLTLTNFMSNVWLPLLEICSHRKPTMMHIGSAPKEWFDSYMHGDEVAMQSALEQMLATVIIQKNA